MAIQHERARRATVLSVGARVSSSGAERRPAIWPWVVMPLAALALFLALHTVRRAAGTDRPGAAAAAMDAGSSQ